AARCSKEQKESATCRDGRRNSLTTHEEQEDTSDNLAHTPADNMARYLSPLACNFLSPKSVNSVIV
ncbi:hypothetical protein BgiMline_014955, partial [Biomphalaria glabrata]